MVYSQYYSEFEGGTFVIQTEGEAVENSATMLAILQGVQDLLSHGIRVLFVFGKGPQFETELRDKYGARTHAETNRLVIPEAALPRIREERARISGMIESICDAGNIPYSLIAESAIRVERRIGHGCTGVPTDLDVRAIRSVLNQSELAVMGFGGDDHAGEFLHVPSVSLAADLAVVLEAQKLLFLMESDGISVQRHNKGMRQISFADLEELLCLLQRQDQRGEFVISSEALPKVHASIRAVAGGVNQIHLVSYSRMLDEILTRTGVGTMIERYQSHHVTHARAEDLDDIHQLHVESQCYKSPCGTPYIKPLEREELHRLLPQTLLLRHRGIIIGKLHTIPISGEEGAFQIGGFVIAENHQDSQQGQLLLSEALARLREQGCTRAFAVTASKKAQSLFQRLGEIASSEMTEELAFLRKAKQRYSPEERDQIKLFEFILN
ncbi:MAG: GNAT family N-acetyltransferase [Pirellulales bacterium]|nr:GNAT family N-acetyltransferase [Pirellulales bacterium]